MRNLLSANFLRLRKNWLFWGVLLFSCGFAVFRIYTLYDDRAAYGVPAVLDEALFTYAMLIGLVAAIFASLFLGTEYSDGTIRNKAAAGCSRLNIYLANLVTVTGTSLLCFAAYLLVAVAAGIPLFGFPTGDARMVLLYLLGCLCMIAAFCGIFTLIAMNCSHKAAVAVICILLFFALMMASTYVFARLDAQEEFLTYSLVDGEMVQSIEPNPRYLRGTERTVYEFLSDFLPTGQSSQYAAQAADHPVRLSLYALLLTAGTTAAGAALFRRKDLK